MIIHPQDRKMFSAGNTLEKLGYTYLGGEWKPPLGISPEPLLVLSDTLKAKIEELTQELADAKLAARWESDLASQALTDIKALEKDAKRYRWLRDRLQIRYETPMIGGLKRAVLATRIGFSFLDSNMNPNAGWISVKSFDECREKVDSGIDAAIAGEAT
jgi:hypothetical protein